MHPDRKIGIAMGILLVGVVAALFFRNEPLAVEEGLSSSRELELNQTLRDRDVAVYLEKESEALSDDTDIEPRWTLPELFKQVRTPDAAPAPIGPQTVTTVEPTPATNAPGAVPLPRNSSRFHAPESPETTPIAAAESVAEMQELLKPRESSSAVKNGDYEEYTVKFGDTLSEISERFLGSQSRYREIYELNKDRMKSPDRLKVGKAIRVPRVLR